MKGTLVVAVLFCIIQIGYCGFAETAYTASLSEDQVVPLLQNGPTTQNVRGTAVCIYDRYSTPPVIDCEVQHEVTDITSAQILVGARGTEGVVFHNFTAIYALNFRQRIPLVGSPGYSVAQQEQDFLNGKFFIQIASRTYPNGLIRGQIEHTNRFYTRLSFANTIPHAGGTSATGVGVGTFSFTSPARKFIVNLVHSVSRPSQHGIQIHNGRRGQVGPMLYNFQHDYPLNYRTTISEMHEFLHDLQYMNIASFDHPSGEIRGQLVTIDYIPEVAFTSRLSSEGVVPAVTASRNRGCALFSFNCETHTLEYLIMHDIPDARFGFIGVGEPGAVGISLFSLNRGASPITGAIQLTTRDEVLLYARQLYVLITSEQYPFGEIRGQINVDNDWWAYLSGTNVVNPVSTASVGCATFFLEGESNRLLNYAIFHDAPEAFRATLSVAPEGKLGPVNRVFRHIYSPIRGNDIQLDDDDLEALVTESMYITIHSNEYPELGQLRGQIKRVNPCTVRHDNSLTVSNNGGSVPARTSVEYQYSTGGGLVVVDQSSTLSISVCLLLISLGLLL